MAADSAPDHTDARPALSRRALLATAGAAVWSQGLASHALAEASTQPAAPLILRPALEGAGEPFEGWGTALAWYANVTGGWPSAERERLADLFFGPGGLGWTIARYNIGGGGKAGETGYLRTGGAVPGFWRRPPGAEGADWWRPDDAAMWDWSADGNQRWWLDAIKVRVKKPIFEAFSNSPPWFMTVSGKVSGAEKGTDDNLRPGLEPLFAAYLARVVDELQRRHRIAFRTLSPVNEPNTDYWHASNTQEGAHWSPARQGEMILAAKAALKARGLRTVVSAPDETNSTLFLEDWAGYGPKVRAAIGQLNVHSYATDNQNEVRDVARAAGIRLWMSEVDKPLDRDPENFKSIGSALALAEHIVGDLKGLEPAAWVFWQAVEDLSARNGRGGSNWGLVKADLRGPAAEPHAIHVTKKYWAMAHFSRYIRPGYRMVPVDDADTVGAISPDGRRLVLVHVNKSPSARRLVVAGDHWSAEQVMTDAANDLQPRAGSEAPSGSIVTLVLTRKRVI